MFLNEAKTELNVILGLCVGHDSLAVIYQAEAYYKDKLFPKK